MPPAPSIPPRRGAFFGAESGRAADNSERMLKEGREIFRHDTFGSENFWGKTRLHEAILGEKQGGVGPGRKAIDMLKVGLKVDIGKLPAILGEVLKEGSVSLEKPETTLELLKADSVLGVKAILDKDGKKVSAIGITCAFCHSTVDDSFAKGIGRRLDGWPNRDLDVGAIVAMAPDLSQFTSLLGVDDATVRKVLKSWGPGKYDAELDQDGKAFRPDGKTAATLICDLIFLLGWGGQVWKDVAYYTMAGGIVGALLAAVPGLVDLLSLSDPKVKKIGVWHMSINLLAVGLFAVNFLLRGGARPEAKLPVALSAIGVVLIGISGWLGGEMVYVHGVAVEPQQSTGRG